MNTILNKKKSFTTVQIIFTSVLILIALISVFLSTKYRNDELVESPILKYSNLLLQPICSAKSGFYDSEFQLKLFSKDKQNKIYYTTDGSKPTLKSNLYSNPILINDNTNKPAILSLIPSSPRWKPPVDSIYKGTILRAIVVNEKLNCSSELICSYFIFDKNKNRYTFPLLSLTINQDDFFGYKNGIYVLGKNFDDKSDYIKKNISLDIPWWEYPSNYLKRGDNSARETRIDFFETNGKLAFSENVGIRINGNATRGFAQKSLRICFDKQYGLDTLRYPIFHSELKQKYNAFILRNSGNDWDKTMFRDMFMQSLLTDKEIDKQQYQPVIVFINGEYWGIHDMCERFDENYLCTKYGLAKDSITILEGSGKLFFGKKKDTNDFQKFIDFVQTMDLSILENYKLVENKMDIDNFITNVVSNIYFANSDWPNNNVKFWRYKRTTNNTDTLGVRDGKYRWMMYDTDWGFGGSSANSYTFNLIEKAVNSGSIGMLLKKLVRNNSFKKKFLDAFQEMLNTNFETITVTKKIDYYEKLFTPEIKEHINRWRVIGSENNWKKNVDVLRTFAKERPRIQAKQLNDYFGLKQKNQIQIK